MDNQRLLIWAFFAMMAWLTWQTWQQDFGPQPAPPPAEQGADAVSIPDVPEGTDAMPELSDDDVPELTEESLSQALTPQAPVETSLPAAAVFRRRPIAHQVALACSTDVRRIVRWWFWSFSTV